MKRIQRKRTKHYKMPDNCKYVGRPGKFGNPFIVSDELTALEATRRYKECILNNAMTYYYFYEVDASLMFDHFKYISEHINDLKQYDYLSCFCPLNKPCHVDVLIELLK